MLPEAAAESYVNRQEAESTEDLAAPQQGATQPESGSAVPASRVHTNQTSANGGNATLPMKTKIEAWAHIHHGTATRNPEEKEHYQKVLAGEKEPPPNEWRHKERSSTK